MAAKSQDPHADLPGGARRDPREWLWALLILGLLVFVLYTTHHEPEPIEQPVAAPNENTSSPIATEEPESEEESEPTIIPPRVPPIDPEQTRVEIETLEDAQPGWLRITSQSSPGRQSTAEARYRGDNEFTIDTVNAQQFEVDLAALPVNRTRRFIMHIDGQDMLLFPEHVGVVRFVRSAAGAWSYDKE